MVDPTVWPIASFVTGIVCVASQTMPSESGSLSTDYVSTLENGILSPHKNNNIENYLALKVQLESELKSNKCNNYWLFLANEKFQFAVGWNAQHFSVVSNLITWLLLLCWMCQIISSYMKQASHKKYWGLFMNKLLKKGIVFSFATWLLQS